MEKGCAFSKQRREPQFNRLEKDEHDASRLVKQMSNCHQQLKILYICRTYIPRITLNNSPFTKTRFIDKKSDTGIPQIALPLQGHQLFLHRLHIVGRVLEFLMVFHLSERLTLKKHLFPQGQRYSLHTLSTSSKATHPLSANIVNDTQYNYSSPRCIASHKMKKKKSTYQQNGRKGK